MQDLKITLIQTDLAWRDRDKNLQHFDELIGQINQPTDLIILPEMFNTGFVTEPQALAESPKGPALKWMFCKAIEKKAVVMGSFIVLENGGYRNRLYAMYPNGRKYFYDKKHLFRMAEEDKFFKPGTEKRIIKIKGWKLNMLICYDLRFPVWARNTYRDNTYEYDCLIYVANWPEVRSHVWKTLLAARAIENQSYVVGVNRIGTDGKGISHSGDSAVYDPWGLKTSKTPANETSVETLTLSAGKLQNYRQSVRFALDWESFSIND
jgi:omega-amidase